MIHSSYNGCQNFDVAVEPTPVSREWDGRPVPPAPCQVVVRGAGGGDALTHRSWTPGGLHLSSISGLGQGEVTQVQCAGVSGLILWWFWHPRCARAGLLSLLSFAISHLSTAASQAQASSHLSKYLRLLTLAVGLFCKDDKYLVITVM